MGARYSHRVKVGPEKSAPRTPSPRRPVPPSKELLDAFEPWRAEGDWQPDSSWLGRHRWKSNEGSYRNHQDSSLTSRPVSLRGLKEGRLKFECDYVTERNIDKVHLEVQPESGGWTRLKEFTGKKRRGEKVEVDLQPFLGQVVRLRFRLHTDGSVKARGFKFQDLRLEGKDVGGQPVQRRLQEDRTDELASLTDTGGLYELVTELGAPDDALALWKIDPYPSPELVGLARETGPAGAVQAAELLKGRTEEARGNFLWLLENADLDSARRAWPHFQSGDEAPLRRLAGALGDSDRAVELWSLAAPHRGSEDFDAIVAGLGRLGGEMKPDQLREQWSLLQHGPQPLSDRMEVFRAARALQPDSPAKAYYGLIQAGMESRSSAVILELLAQNHDWKAGGDWGRHDPWFGETYWNDSPGRKYNHNRDSNLTSPPLELQGLQHPQLVFQAKVDTERNIDRVTLEGRLPGGSWKELKQFSGKQRFFAEERIDLESFGQRTVELRFRFHSDGSVNGNGFSFKNLRVVGDNGESRRPVTGVSKADREKLLELALKDPRAFQDLEALDQLSLRDALVFLQTFKTSPSDPEYGRRRGDLSELFRVAGSHSAGQVWGLVEGLDAKTYQQRYPLLKWATERVRGEVVRDLWAHLESADQAHLQVLADGVGGFEAAARLWPMVASRRSEASFPEELEQLTELVREVGLEEAVKRVQPGSTMAQDLALHQLAGRLEPEAPESLFNKLSAAQLDLGAAEALLELTTEVEFWKPEGAWGRERSWRRGQVWSDSPGRKYGNNVDQRLTSQPISLSGLGAPRLQLDTWFKTENNIDYAELSIRRNGGGWKQLKRFSGKQRSWKPEELDLSEYGGSKVELAFRFHSDSSVQADGFSFANLKLLGESANGDPVERSLDHPDGKELKGRLLNLAFDPNLAPSARNQQLKTLAAAARQLGSLEAAFEYLPHAVGGPELLDAFDRYGPGHALRARRLGVALKGKDSKLEWLSTHGARLEDQVWKGVLEGSLELTDLDAMIDSSRALTDDPAEQFRLVNALASTAASSDQVESLKEFADTFRGWEPGGGWGQERTLFHGRVWSDSPNSKTASSSRATLTSAPLKLDGLEEAALEFDCKVDLEDGIDVLYVEYSDGGNWKELAHYTGRLGWDQRRVSLEGLGDGRVRFRMRTDGSVNRSGFKMKGPRLVGYRGGRRLNRALEARGKEGLAAPILERLEHPDRLLLWMNLVSAGLESEADHPVLQLEREGNDPGGLGLLVEALGAAATRADWELVKERPAQRIPLLEASHRLGEGLDRSGLDLFRELEEAEAESVARDLRTVAGRCGRQHASLVARVALSRGAQRATCLGHLAIQPRLPDVLDFLSSKKNPQLGDMADFLQRLSEAQLLEGQPLTELMEELYEESASIEFEDDWVIIGDHGLEIKD